MREGRHERLTERAERRDGGVYIVLVVEPVLPLQPIVRTVPRAGAGLDGVPWYDNQSGEKLMVTYADVPPTELQEPKAQVLIDSTSHMHRVPFL